MQQLEQKLKEIKTIAFITDQGLSSGKLVTVQLERIFGKDIQVKVINENQIQLNDIDQFDLVVSTIKVIDYLIKLFM